VRSAAGAKSLATGHGIWHSMASSDHCHHPQNQSDCTAAAPASAPAPAAAKPAKAAASKPATPAAAAAGDPTAFQAKVQIKVGKQSTPDVIPKRQAAFASMAASPRAAATAELVATPNSMTRCFTSRGAEPA
jgi:hypothetical protein